MRRRWNLCRVAALVGVCLALGALPAGAKPPRPLVTPAPKSAPATPSGTIPPGLPAHFWIGLANEPSDLDWMTGSGIAWDARYQYLTGGANTPDNWTTWNTPAGQFATYYLNDSFGGHYLPVFTYYQLLDSLPHQGADEAAQDFNNLNNPATMAAYYADFHLLLTKAAAFGHPVLVHVEPDFWGYMEQRVLHTTNSAADVPASVASSGYAAVAGYPNTVQGFAQALLHLRDVTAPNVIMAIHASHWAWNGPDIGTSDDSSIDANAVGAQIGAFLRTAGIAGNPPGTSSWDLVVGDPSDRDAAYYQIVRGDGGAHWWDLTGATFPNFDRYRTYIAALNRATGRRILLWQIPIGNTVMRTSNNSTGHYQDNRVQGFLGNNGAALPAWINAGLIGLLWGAGAGGQSTNTDAQGDGITNPAPINGNNTVATVADDDGGYLRTQAAGYYSRGPLPLPAAGCGLFSDVPTGYWAYAYINALACRSIVTGYADGTFRPDTPTTRAQFAKMLVLGVGWTVVNPPTPSFRDVPATFWAYTFVETAKAHGVISGYADGTFHPNANITRAQLSKMIVSAEAWTLLNPPTPSFHDVPVGNWAYPFVETAKAHNVVAGYADGTFRPNTTATRAQLSKMLAVALGLP